MLDDLFRSPHIHKGHILFDVVLTLFNGDGEELEIFGDNLIDLYVLIGRCLESIWHFERLLFFRPAVESLSC